jgi:CAAX prenyl protease-like protein
VTRAPSALLLSTPRHRAASVRIAPFALFIAVLAARGALGDDAGGRFGFDARWLYGVQAAAALAALLAWRAHYIEFAQAPRSASSWLVSVGAGLALFLLWIAPMPGWMHLGVQPVPFVPLADDGTLRWGLVVARAAGAALVVPLMEELFWRSFLMRWIDRRDFLALPPGHAGALAVLASSGVFALAHDLWLAALLAGLVYAQLYRRLGNLWYPVIAHATTNLALAAWVVGQRAWSYW